MLELTDLDVRTFRRISPKQEFKYMLFNKLHGYTHETPLLTVSA